jgi:hypothetical protein
MQGKLQIKRRKGEVSKSTAAAAYWLCLKWKKIMWDKKSAAAAVPKLSFKRKKIEWYQPKFQDAIDA